ncbi:MAG: 50S ribosomal protein L11 methyltransferase [Clostridia bacterium]|nr:50S ribosomal protein L11 methyltransferase [Clostridia bacterium]
MDWHKISIHTTTMGADIISMLLMDAGAVGTQVLDRLDVLTSDKKDGMWDMIDEQVLDSLPEDVVVEAYYPPELHISEIIMPLEQRLAPLKGTQNGFDMGTLAIDRDTVHEEDWAENWKKYYKPIHIGNLVICPSWEKYEPAENEHVIVMDPGMAFGTGTHETTAMCMDHLCHYMNKGETCIDVGCGSGILGIAAAKLGAKHVLAIDLDPDAVRVAEENVERNQLSSTITVMHGDLLEHQEEKANVIVANIIADVICFLCTPVKSHLLPDGVFICSGIIKEREPDVLHALENAGYQIDRRLEKGEWVSLAARLK